MCNDWQGLPKSLTITCACDILRDDGLWYIERLRKNKVEISHKHYDSAFHGILSSVGEIELANKMMNDITFFILENI